MNTSGNVTREAAVSLQGHPDSQRALVFGAIGLVFAWLIVWYWDTAAQMALIWWRSETYAHGLVVVPVFTWLVWRLRAQLDRARIEPTAWMAIPVVLAGLGWMLGKMVSVNALAHASLVSMLIFSLVGVLGWRVARVLSFPLLFLYFAVPIGDFLLPTLMNHTAEFTVWALRLSGVPVYQEGLFFIVPNGRWSVVEACSGIRYLIASLMVGTLYAYLNYRSLSRRLLFVGVAIIVPIVANWLRAYFIVMLGYLSDNRIAAGVDHLLYGWVFFGVVILLMFWIGSRWHEDAGLPRAERAGDDGATAGHTGQLWRVGAFALVAAAFPFALQLIDKPATSFEVDLAAPTAAAGWTPIEEPTPEYLPNYSGHRGELYRDYEREDGRLVGLYVAYYAEQREDSELIAWGNRLTGRGEGGWRLQSTVRDRLVVGPVLRSTLARDGGRVAVWHWYWSNRRIVNSDMIAKLLLALDRLTGQDDDAAFVAVIAPFDESPEETRSLVEAFLESHSASLQSMLEQAGAHR